MPGGGLFAGAVKDKVAILAFVFLDKKGQFEKIVVVGDALDCGRIKHIYIMVISP